MSGSQYSDLVADQGTRVSKDTGCGYALRAGGARHAESQAIRHRKTTATVLEGDFDSCPEFDRVVALYRERNNAIAMLQLITVTCCFENAHIKCRADPKGSLRLLEVVFASRLVSEVLWAMLPDVPKPRG